MYVCMYVAHSICCGFDYQHNQHLRHYQHHQSDNLELFKDSHIGLVIKVLQGDFEVVIAFEGELVDIFETKPQLPCNGIKKGRVPKLNCAYIINDLGHSKHVSNVCMKSLSK